MYKYIYGSENVMGLFKIRDDYFHSTTILKI